MLNEYQKPATANLFSVRFENSNTIFAVDEENKELLEFVPNLILKYQFHRDDIPPNGIRFELLDYVTDDEKSFIESEVIPGMYGKKINIILSRKHFDDGEYKTLYPEYHFTGCVFVKYIMPIFDINDSAAYYEFQFEFDQVETKYKDE